MAHKLLQTKAVKLNWFVYYSLDSVCIILVGLAMCIFIVRAIARSLRGLFKGGKQNAKVKTK